MTNKRAVFSVLITIFLLFTPAVQAREKSLLKEIYAREACTILRSSDGEEIAGLARKGEALLVLRPAFSFISDTTNVRIYKVRTGKGIVGYVLPKYLTYDKEEAGRRYMAEKYDSLHRAAIDRFHGGTPLGCDFYPKEKPVFENNRMPQVCYSLYITASPASLRKMDEYIALAKTTCINTFVIDIKEDGVPGFKADAMKKYCPSAYASAGDNEELYRSVVEKIHAAGYWAVGRIVTFKDYHFTKDHPECALWDKVNDEMLLHNKSHWPSAFCRKVWEYNAALACEAVEKIGFNEINFDYVRFPDRLNSLEGSIDMRNSYGESKIQAIQRFVAYAADQLHSHNAYISIDVFGESANPGYTTPYGQYWPAISNVADVICGMPYPDHFSNGYYGINKPWNHPYEILKAWGQRVQDRQAETPSPAIVRTWIQSYHVLRFVDRNGIDYNAENMTKEIRGLYDAGLTGGYTTWLSSGSLESYRSKADAFRIDYYKEWLSRKNTKSENEEKHITAP
ncbi:MAG: putative glycoside hydrolase [Bacteroidales bacterium]|nr:putative glycoside hydrolase [Bacteroidales bacterium]